MNAYIIPVTVHFADNDPHNLLPEVQDPFPDGVRNEKKRNIGLNQGGSPGHQEHPRQEMNMICRFISLYRFPMRQDSFLIMQWIDPGKTPNLPIPLHFFSRIPSDKLTTGIVGSRLF